MSSYLNSIGMISPPMSNNLKSSENISQQYSSSPILTKTIQQQLKQQKIDIEYKPIILEDWQQSDLNHDAEKIHFTASYYKKKSSLYLKVGTFMQFFVLILSLSGSYIATFGNFQDYQKSILMSVLNLSTAIISGIYTFFGFTKKGQSYKEAAIIMFNKIEKLKLAITTMRSDKEYEDMKASLIETLLKYDSECIREKYNYKTYVSTFRDEIEQNLVRKVIKKEGQLVVELHDKKKINFNDNKNPITYIDTNSNINTISQNTANLSNTLEDL